MKPSNWIVLLVGLTIAGCSKQESGPSEPSPATRTPAAPAPVPPTPAEKPPTSGVDVPTTPSTNAPTPPPVPEEKPNTNAPAASAESGFQTNLSTTNQAGGSAPAKDGLLSAANLSSDQFAQALKEALGQGLKQAIAQLGKDGGFLTNQLVRIPMPESLRRVETALRTLRQDAVADQFIATMNHAAEQAVPAAADVFAGALKQMTIDDARTILTSTNNAATMFFRRTTETQLKDRFLPIVKEATTKAGLTAAYKQLTDKVRVASPFLNLQALNLEALDLDNYVTSKTLDGLFTLVAQEEKRIRENPAARTTQLVKAAFDLFKK